MEKQAKPYAAIFKDKKILVVKESIDGCWSLSGRWAEVDLPIEENIIKEVKEEAGVDVISKKYNSCYKWHCFSLFNAIYIVWFLNTKVIY